MNKKLAVFFPGMGYTVDKPLLYYSRKIAAELGYEIRLVSYSGFPKKKHGDRATIETSYQIALPQAEQMVSDIDLGSYEDILFVGKSIGTIVGAKIASQSTAWDRIRHVLYTPVEDTFAFSCKEAIVFTGSNDPWAGGEQSRITALSAEKGYPCHLIPDANHSLETQDVKTDIRNLQEIMEETRAFFFRKAVYWHTRNAGVMSFK